MRSLKARLALSAMFATLVVGGLCAFMLYDLIQDDMERALDRELTERAYAQASLVEFDNEGLRFEWQHTDDVARLQVLSRWFEVRTPEGKLVTASDTMKDGGFQYLEDDADPGEALEVIIPGAGPGRAVSINVTPEVEDNVKQPPPQLVLTVAEPTAPLDDTLAGIRNWILFAGAVGVLLAAGLVWLILRRELRPVDALARAIGELDSDSLGQAIEVKRAPLELEPVIRQLNELLARVRDTLRREKEFAIGAAHELRTPLAGIRAKLELALSRERTPAEHRSMASDALSITADMQLIVDNLMALSRAETESGLGEPVGLDVAQELQRVAKPYLERAAARGITSDWDFNGKGSVRLRPGPLLLLLRNLLENAAQYADDGGRIEIEGASDPERGLRLSISNSGCGLDPVDADRVFEPFWRGDKVRGEGTHAGLGLAICKRLAVAMHGRIEASIRGDVFRVELEVPPVA